MKAYQNVLYPKFCPSVDDNTSLMNAIGEEYKQHIASRMSMKILEKRRLSDSSAASEESPGDGEVKVEPKGKRALQFELII